MKKAKKVKPKPKPKVKTLVQMFGSSWVRSALCVHHYEGSWYANTGNGFYGGMQFDYGTWLRSGGGRYSKYAHQTSPRNQLIVAHNLWTRSGWYPWPNTARFCGLI